MFSDFLHFISYLWCWFYNTEQGLPELSLCSSRYWPFACPVGTSRWWSGEGRAERIEVWVIYWNYPQDLMNFYSDPDVGQSWPISQMPCPRSYWSGVTPERLVSKYEGMEFESKKGVRKGVKYLLWSFWKSLSKIHCSLENCVSCF